MSVESDSSASDNHTCQWEAGGNTKAMCVLVGVFIRFHSFVKEKGRRKEGNSVSEFRFRSYQESLACRHLKGKQASIFPHRP